MPFIVVLVCGTYEAEVWVSWRKKKDCLKKKREGPRELIMWGLDGGKEKRNILH